MPAVASTSATTEAVDRAGAPYQPFQCPTCLKRFTRQENLKRHAALHLSTEASVSFQCEFCPAAFGRQDLRQRHVKTKHADLAEVSQVAGPSRPRAARATKSKKGDLAPPSSTAGGHPTPPAPPAPPPPSSPPLSAPLNSTPSTFLDLNGPDGSWDFDLLGGLGTAAGVGVGENLWSAVANGAPPARLDSTQPQGSTSLATSSAVVSSSLAQRTSSPGGPSNCQKCASTSPVEISATPDEFTPSASQICRGVELFFCHIATFLPFLHRPTFDPSVAADYLLPAILALGYQYGDDPDSDEVDSSGVDLSLRCFRLSRGLIERRGEDPADSTQSLAIVQAYILLQAYSMFYLPGSSEGLRMHSKVVDLSRSSGLMQPLISNPGAMPDLESLWREFVKTESHKRTMLNLHHMDALWYQLLSVPRLISHPEIKHDMPCAEALWNAPSAADWAHRNLCPSRAKSTPVRYSDAIRKVLCAAETGEVPPPEFYTVGVLHFLTSSLREVSGYSAMTGMVSPERFKALSESLSAAGPSLRSHAQATTYAQRLILEATWEMAMFETVSWSSSHMGGVVESSLDAALATAACLATSSGILIEPACAHSLQVHINFFLLHLERTPEAATEPPFVTVYCFKAFLVAWQLLRAGTKDAMTVVGVEDGDFDGALEWAHEVFEKRERWKVGKLALQNLNSLEEVLA